MISYAQHAEDVVLARALPAKTGFYVDVGAADPEVASVTKHFYDSGWHGINIDPRAASVTKLRESRSRDINLQVAAGARNGRVELFHVREDPDLSTFSPEDRDFLRSRGYSDDTEEVEVRTLDSILEEFQVGSIDFLKIDVEGAEREVLEGIDLRRWRPRVIVVEAVMPYSHVRTDSEWRNLLEDGGYTEGFFDGLNLFFAPSDDPEVLSRLFPASPVDDYETASELNLRAYIAQLERHVADLELNQQQVTDYVKQLEGMMLGEQPDPLAPFSGTGRAHSPRLPCGPRATRLAIVGTPHSGGMQIARKLGQVLDVEELLFDHPADVPWADLPSGFVMRLHWGRTRQLESSLSREGITVVSPARYPTDVLLSLARSSDHPAGNALAGEFDGDRLSEWFLSPAVEHLLRQTPSWWAVPATVRTRYETFFSDTEAELARILRACDLPIERDLKRALEAEARSASLNGESAPGGQPINEHDPWSGLVDESVVKRIWAAYEDVFVALGYGDRSPIDLSTDGRPA